jgi:hypothetical protein
MNNNPFQVVKSESEYSFKEKSNSPYYVDFVADQVLPIELEESIEADLGGKGVHEFRSALQYVARGYGIKVKTKTNSDGVLWIKRIS